MPEDAIIAASPEIPCTPTTSDNPTDTQPSPSCVASYPRPGYEAASCAALPVSELSDHLNDEVLSTPSMHAKFC